MTSLIIIEHKEVQQKFDSYPDGVKSKMEKLRKLIIETARDIESIKEIEETLKWGEPSYVVKKGSTLRIDWKDRAPHQYAMYFNCQSSLVPTFKVLYGGMFRYEKDRAIVFDLEDELPLKELKECIALALTYHSVKNLPLLGK